MEAIDRYPDIECEEELLRSLTDSRDASLSHSSANLSSSSAIDHDIAPRAS